MGQAPRTPWSRETSGMREGGVFCALAGRLRASRGDPGAGLQLQEDPRRVGESARPGLIQL